MPAAWLRCVAESADDCAAYLLATGDEMTTTKERPILFSGEMVRAILDGRKTQTRRVIKPHPSSGVRWSPVVFAGHGGWTDGHGAPLRCRYGGPDDLLWVRETWQDLRPHQERVVYAATLGDVVTKWRPSIHMPRWASRITLRVVDVRVERLQGISHKDAQAEGIYPNAAGYLNAASPFDGCLKHDYVTAFRSIWNSINAARGYDWETNPWVWVVEFEKVTP